MLLYIAIHVVYIHVHAVCRCVEQHCYGCCYLQLVRRVMERNRLSEEEAMRRLAAQPSNQFFVDHAHIVIGTQWELEVSRGQVEKAWLKLMEKINQ